MPQQTDLAKIINFKTPGAASAEVPAPAPTPSKPAALSDNSMLAQAIIGLAPILAGAALRGAEGGAAGARAGLTGLSALETSRKEREAKEEEEKRLAKAEKKEDLQTALLLAKEERATKAEERASRAEERAEKRQLSEIGLSQKKLDLEQQRFLAEAGSSKKILDQLSPENKVMVEKLSDDSAKKTAIASEIAQTVKLFDDPKISDDQKIKAGQGLLKVLNSTQGADAVGVEESRRLGSLLEYQMFNLTGPGKMFGRDLPAFRDQAATTVNRLSGAIDNNRLIIKQALSGQAPSVKKIPLLEQKRKPFFGVSLDQEAVAGPPAKVIQNGIEYTLNPETGKYE